MVQDAARSGSSVVESAYMFDYELEWGKWHRSNDKKSGDNPFSSFMMNKKWILEEEFNNHILRFQQVTVISK